MRLVSVIIPTFRRMDLLPIAIDSLFAQDLNGTNFEIVAVDNSPEGSALAYLNERKLNSPVPMVVVHESRPGVAYARNAALEASRGDLIAFLDDDTRCDPNWLQELVRVRDEFDASMVFSPSIAIAEAAHPAHRSFIEGLFTRAGAGNDEYMSTFSGASSSLHVRDFVLDMTPPFPLDTNDSGGEDDVVFSRAQNKGGKIAWAAKARVFEIIPAPRANLRYAYRRSFAFGQGAPYNAFYGEKSVLHTIRHMAIGLGQMTVFGVLGGAAWLINHPRRAATFDHAVRGAGKVFWFKQLHFYGAWLEQATRGQTGTGHIAPAANQNDAPIARKRSADAC